MPGTIEYIESYFHQTLNSDEKKAFENRCETDAAFASEVAMYIATLQVLRETLLEQKSAEWKAENEVEQEAAVPVIPMFKRSGVGKWIMYAAAACLLLVASVFLFEVQTSPHNVASKYINNYDLSSAMDASHDSLELGISAYKDKDYDKSLQYFEGVEQSDPSNSDAKKYAGLAYLQKENYNKAIQQFDELAKMELHNNAGDFLKAATLLKRNNPGDKEAAKALLQKVVNEKEEGSEKAEEWLKKF
jgi:tetratricopeptide (TPR) repeat protein